ncbi:MAG: PQQ-binding-like beta-propeller repeat protein [Saprospiraceae bacterium]|nr:PQQ-binding-like beta-propeller repeat protein [Saprospiraceae bacterium]
MRWKLETNSKILGGPVNDDQNIYVGNEGGDFYSIDLKNGKINWKFETDGKVQAKALLINNIVFFESGNTYYALNKHEGALIWKYDLGKEAEKFTYSGVDYLYILDPYDDKHASAIVYDELIYTGTSHGEVLGFHINSGEVLFKITLSGNVPIRSTPLIQEGRIYIGDWNGVVYCYDIESKLLRWKKRTYRKKPYATFGGIASEFIIHKGKLFFGARNHMLNVLWTEDGQKEWTYTDPNGGWLISDPVVMNDTLYVGGSDNFSMLALDANDGRLLWTCTRKKNIYAKASVTTDWVIYGGGNSYDPKDTGELVILNRKDGNVLDVFQTSSSVFSAPLLIKNKSVIFGSNDGTIYSLSIN